MSTEARFQKSRWSPTRHAINGMEKQTKLSLPLEQYFNAHSSVYRLNDAYAGKRRYTMHRNAEGIYIERIK